jgi:hypothetical protein
MRMIAKRTILSKRSASVTLLINWTKGYSKSQMVALNLNEEQVILLAHTFSCQLGSPPFTYLGILLGTTKPRVRGGHSV